MTEFNANEARALATKSTSTEPTKELEAIKRAASLGNRAVWFANLPPETIKTLERLGFNVVSMPDRNETTDKVSW